MCASNKEAANNSGLNSAERSDQNVGGCIRMWLSPVQMRPSAWQRNRMCLQPLWESWQLHNMDEEVTVFVHFFAVDPRRKNMFWLLEDVMMWIVVCRHGGDDRSGGEQGQEMQRRCPLMTGTQRTCLNGHGCWRLVIGEWWSAV